MAHLSDVLVRLLEGVHREEVARLERQFAADDIFIDAGVAVDFNLVDAGLCSLEDANLKVDRVAFLAHFDGLDAVEHVTVVVVIVRHSVIVFLQALLDVLHVVHVALLHAQHVVEGVCRVDGVAHPRDVAHIVFLALVEMDEDIDGVVAEVHYAVGHNLSVAVAEFVVLLDDALLVFLVFFGGELLGSEDVGELVLVRLLEKSAAEGSADNLSALQVVVACDVDVADLDFLLLVNVDIDDHVVLLVDVVALHDVHLGILESFLVEVSLDDKPCAVHHVGRNLVAADDAYLLLQVVALRLLHAVDVDAGDAWTGGQHNLEIDAVVLDFLGFDACAAEQAVLPVALHCGGDFVAWHRDFFSDAEAGDADEKIVFVVVDAFDRYAADGHSARLSVDDVGLICILLRTGLRREEQCREGEEGQFFYVHCVVDVSWVFISCRPRLVRRFFRSGAGAAGIRRWRGRVLLR